MQKDKNKIKFVAQIYNFSCIIVLFCTLAVIIFTAIGMAFDDNVHLTDYIIVVAVALLFFAPTFGIAYYSGAYLTVKDEQIELRGFFGVMRRYSLSDIEKIVYDEIKFVRTTEIRARLIIVDKQSTDRRMNIRSNGKRKFIKLDFTKKVLKHVRTFWQGEIENLPEKYESHTDE